MAGNPGLVPPLENGRADRFGGEGVGLESGEDSTVCEERIKALHITAIVLGHPTRGSKTGPCGIGAGGGGSGEGGRAIVLAVEARIGSWCWSGVLTRPRLIFTETSRQKTGREQAESIVEGGRQGRSPGQRQNRKVRDMQG